MKSPAHHPFLTWPVGTRLALGVVALFALSAQAASPAGHRRGFGSPGYVWNGGRGERLEALRKHGDPTRGAPLFAACVGCHKANAAGTANGWLPRLAGQHSSVLVKQLADIRSGLRDNEQMYPIAATLIDAQELADVAAYIQTLSVTAETGLGRGVALERGERLFQQRCATCHGARGEGDATRLFPKLAGQHYFYLLRQTQTVKAGQRRNAHPDMVRALAPLADDDLQAITDWLSRQGGVEPRH